MDITTPFGVKWNIASNWEILLVFLIFGLIAVVLGFVKYQRHLKSIKINNYQLFLFKMKRLGLSNFQIKIINNMVDILRLSNPVLLLNQSRFFESAVGKFLIFLREGNESEESLTAICKDITITYEKLYHPASFKRPLETIAEIELNQLLYFLTENDVVYLGKIIEKNSKKGTLGLRLFRNPKKLQELSEEQQIRVFFWRSGDAEYSFTTKTVELEGDLLTVLIPDEFTREREVRHPYCDVILPAVIVKTDLGPIEEVVEIKGTIYKINDYEAVVRVADKLDYRHRYSIHFEVMEFKFEIISKLIANRTIEEENILYYTFKFEKMSDAAKKVLKQYIYEHL